MPGAAARFGLLQVGHKGESSESLQGGTVAVLLRKGEKKARFGWKVAEVVALLQLQVATAALAMPQEARCQQPQLHLQGPPQQPPSQAQDQVGTLAAALLGPRVMAQMLASRVMLLAEEVLGRAAGMQVECVQSAAPQLCCGASTVAVPPWLEDFAASL